MSLNKVNSKRAGMDEITPELYKCEANPRPRDDVLFDYVLNKTRKSDIDSQPSTASTVSYDSTDHVDLKAKITETKPFQKVNTSVSFLFYQDIDKVIKYSSDSSSSWTADNKPSNTKSSFESKSMMEKSNDKSKARVKRRKNQVGVVAAPANKQEIQIETDKFLEMADRIEAEEAARAKALAAAAKIKTPEPRPKVFENCVLINDSYAPRYMLNSAALTHFRVSQRFWNEARNMVFVPKTKSFHPKGADNLLRTII